MEDNRNGSPKELFTKRRNKYLELKIIQEYEPIVWLE